MSVTASSPSFPHVRGIQQTTKILAPASTQINPGDNLYDNGSGVAGLASAYTWTTDLATTQTNFVLVYMGYSLDQRLSTDATTTNQILVCTESGAARFSCTALGQAYDIGQYFGLDKDPAGNNLLDQVVVPVSTAAKAIGKLIEYAPSGATSVLLHVRGALPLGGLS